jgi:hypothetical protein
MHAHQISLATHVQLSDATKLGAELLDALKRWYLCGTLFEHSQHG